MRRGIPACTSFAPRLGWRVSASAAEGFRTTTFGNAERCEVRGTLRADADSLRFDLRRCRPTTKIWRAVLRVSAAGHPHGAAVRLAPAGLAEPSPPLRPPLYDSFDATECVQPGSPSPRRTQVCKSSKAAVCGSAMPCWK